MLLTRPSVRELFDHVRSEVFSFLTRPHEMSNTMSCQISCKYGCCSISYLLDACGKL